jgi:hypothetical protein
MTQPPGSETASHEELERRAARIAIETDALQGSNDMGDRRGVCA